MPNPIIPIFIIIALCWVTWTIWLRRASWATIFEWERGLMYKDGKYVSTLEPGRYLYFTPWQQVIKVDLRLQVLNVVNQEIICADSLALRISCSVTHKIVDPVLATQSAARYQDLLYLDMQVALRELISTKKVEEVLAERNQLSDQFLKRITETGTKLGLEVTSAGLRDITFPPDVKKIFAQVTAAEKAAQASLTKARAETASLRALANASRLMEDHPALLTLRTLQSVSELAATTGNTVIFGLPQGSIILPQGEQPRSTRDE